MTTTPAPTEPPDPTAAPETAVSDGGTADLRRHIARLELELDRRSQEVADLHGLLRRLTVPATEAPGAGRRNLGVMLVVMIIAPALIILLVVLLAVVRR